VKLSVVVGTWNRRAQLQGCLQSIFAQTATAVCVYVTDAGSTDGTVEYLRSVASDRLIPVFEGRRLGQARAYNAVFTRVDTPYVCWLSDDNVIVDGGLDAGVRILDEVPRIGMVALKVKDVAGPFVDAPYIGGLSSAGILNVNQGMLRTEILRTLGGFSERFRDYGIDPDLTARVLFSGHDIAYTRQVAIHHHRNWSLDPASEAYREHGEKQAAYLRLYRARYGSAGPPGVWSRAVRWLGRKILRRLNGGAVSLDSSRPILGLLPRDWYNIGMGSFISPLDPLRCRGKEYYLVQHCPPRRRPAALPTDTLPEPDLDGVRAP
jgi:GT2 family glycosyltransferase